MSLTNIYFNKKNSLYDLDLVIKDLDDIPIANEKIENNNGYTLKTGEFEKLSIPIKFKKRNKRSIFNNAFIFDWISDINDNNLIFSFNQDRCYKVKRVEINKSPRLYKKSSELNLTFICEPFVYEINEQYMDLKNNSNIFYKGTVPGECNIKIYGSGNIQLTINSETIQINNVNEYVELDSKLILCLNKDKTSKTRDMIGHFPLLTRGINNISWTGNVTKVEILPRTAYR